MVVILLALAVAFANRSVSNQLRTESDVAGVRAYELGSTWNNLKIMQVWSDFRQQPMKQRVAWVGGEDLNGNGKLDKDEDANDNHKLDPAHAPDYQDSSWMARTAGATCTRIKVMQVARNEYALVRFTTWARTSDDMRSREVIRKIQRVVRFELGPASAFDYAYFANNHAYIAGDKLVIHGSVGSNGDLELSGNPLVNGNLYAATNPEIGALGKVIGTAHHDTLESYRSAGSALMRPSNPAAEPEDTNGNFKLDPGEDKNGNGMLDNFSYVMGYDGNPSVKQMQDQEVMPDFGNMDFYRELSSNFKRPARPDLAEKGGDQGGIVKQLKTPGLDPAQASNYNVLIDGTYGFNGELGFESIESNNGITQKDFTTTLQPDPTKSWQNGNVALIGTADQPIVVIGPVVISQDLLIKGVITGQGTFYTGRNTHVVGDLTYANGPAWKQNDFYFSQTAAANKQKDIVGFGVAGNVVFGDYTQADSGADNWNVVLKMLKPPQTHAQILNFSLLDLLLGMLDKLNGYDNGFGWFDGDYTKLDGGRFFNDNGTVPLLGNRRFYESSFPKAYVHSIATNPRRVEGIFYTYHFFGGRLDSMVLHGAMIARDDAIVTSDRGTIYYDPRISKQEPQTYVNLFLPRTSAMAVISVKEQNADDATAASPDW